MRALRCPWFDPAETSGIITPFVVLYNGDPVTAEDVKFSLERYRGASNKMFQQQAMEVDRKRREATLHRIQQLVHEKAMFSPIWQLAAMSGVGPRVAESGIGLVAGYAFFSAPCEDVKLKAK